MKLLEEMLILLGRVVTILPLMLFAALFMGRRSVGELPVFDFLILLAFGAVVGADIADPNIPHIHTAVAIILIALLQKIVAYLKIKSRKIGRLLTFEPITVINDGQFIVKNLKKTQYSIDNILLMLREKDIFDIRGVRMGILEANGNLTVLKKAAKAPVTLEDMKLSKATEDFAMPLIIDGKLYHQVLAQLNLNEGWLNAKLAELSIQDMKEVFFASITEDKVLHISLKKHVPDSIPPIYH
ncbi:DUF421 domain-containing protein [Mesobacillus subterraneus]|uniref:DUF421 domain-containing protein n=1 Tax=Mesobacillus subterraneus TaxID=285983 RepID=A0A3R9DRB9_9BACI|nr:DUF421 domain-containing protein [Mesobacillus subterraneus]RSD25493.1 DUF421 domain-containing protein [Mesobacillus subterraneus]